MDDIEIATWREFPQALDSAARLLAGKSDQRLVPEALLYRGSASADWKLQTTLERRIGAREMGADQYVMWALHYLREVEAKSGRRWEAPMGYEAIRSEMEARECRDPGIPPSSMHLPAYSYLVYLRQHGFASPLLDWTRSPYIAAYFAFWQSSHGNGGRASIHVFSECPDGFKSREANQDLIKVWGPFTDTHQRHFVQQAWYTTATKWDDENGRHVFVPHEGILAKPGARQDMCVRITIPRSERCEILRWMHLVNINSYTLFGTEDSLVQAIDSRVFDGDFDAILGRLDRWPKKA